MEVPVEMIYDPNFSIENLETILETKSLPSSMQTAPSSNQLEEDSKLDADITPQWKSEHGEATGILITGATGFLGQFILHEVLSRSKESSIYCLVRCKDVDEGKRRLEGKISYPLC